ncbi:siphovirus Gp157 family protein [Limosilactobacillus fermentum]|uniref:siphovirus Gp157 family protein n=1 Tax=Limosilactobacillus fermentum TaxID=1613 RepID=UPI002AC9E91A|nr:siphovirus Gp157 family protein [Limosilactobacillus fermentum]
MNLFELNDAFSALQERDDLDPTVLADSLDAIQASREVKWDNIATWIDRNNATVDWVSKRIKELQDQKKHLENQTKSLMAYLTDSIDDAGYKEARTDNHLLKPRNYKASVVVTDDDKLPLTFVNRETKVTVRPDKKALYEALKAGETVPGAHLEPNRGTVIK